MLSPSMELKFWRIRQGGEVDFILLKDRVPLPIEVKGRLASPAVPAGLKKFLSAYPVKSALVINEEISEKVDFKGCAVRFITFEDFALKFRV